MKFSNLFCDHAVLQQGKPIFLKGTCRPYQTIVCELAGVKQHCLSDVNGGFSVFFPKMEVGGPYEITARTLDGQESCRIEDVMVGEVWIASGQSNMSYTFGYPYNIMAKSLLADSETGLSLDHQAFMDANTEPHRIRFFTVEHLASGRREPDVNGEWHVADEVSVPTMTAVGGWFALYLAKQLPGVAVGIIDSSWGGTITEAWTSEPTLTRNPDEDGFLEEYAKRRADDEMWGRLNPETLAYGVPTGIVQLENQLVSKSEEKDVPVKGCQVLDPGISDFAKEWASPDYDASEWPIFRIPGSWMERRISGNGAVWLRQELILPDFLEEDEWTLNLGPVDKTDIAYVNGQEVGRTGSGLDVQYWNRPRHYPLPKGIVRPGRNVIAIRAFSHSYDGAFQGHPSIYNLSSPKNGRFFNCDWRIKCELDFGRLSTPPGAIGALFGPGNPNVPAILFDSMIRPLASYGFRGAIWYQGESNANRDLMSRVYTRKIKDLILDWRHLLENGDFPFIQVQLPIYREYSELDADSSWALVRDCQEEVTHLLPDVGCIPALDQGEADDIHPARKELIGERLARWALHFTYGKTCIVTDGPICLSAVREGEKIRLHFDSRLRVDESFGTLGIGIGLAQESMKPATARLDGVCDILVDAPDGDTEVCYAWGDNPPVALYNEEGLPAKPFWKKVE